ncbi:hypothetical protein FOXB_17326 [Fusarium oxysporum f. sp. conglutinans Fo5176]|uniref:Uncharacterized protein n=1 Tax=Fusarium oxysporum (strain Fo5176) TaxID=660025 RepID=F9GF92_FUSOF|nr:hypothetical protein FOXB_17326 [Fusarium oxysporum f. sp. conglutinans Fo5176]
MHVSLDTRQSDWPY